jgi:hypothetical protein
VNTQPVGQHEPGLYEIRLEGRLHERWLAWFDGMTLTSVPNPSPDSPGSAGAGVVTILRGPVADQAALHGILARLRDLGMPLISIARVEKGAADNDGTGATGEPHTAPERSSTAPVRVQPRPEGHAHGGSAAE